MKRIPHYHVLDNADGDWGAYPSHAAARLARSRIVADSPAWMDEPLRPDELTIVTSAEWCALNDEPCEFDRNAALDATLRQVPEWTHDFPRETPAIFRIDGKRVPRWRLMTALPIEDMATAWPFVGHPVALPQWRHDIIIMNPELCGCKTRGHRRKGCIIGPKGRKCSICGALYEDYGNSQNYCLGCDDWKDRREAYLAERGSELIRGRRVDQQLVLL